MFDHETQRKTDRKAFVGRTVFMYLPELQGLALSFPGTSVF